MSVLSVRTLLESGLPASLFANYFIRIDEIDDDDDDDDEVFVCLSVGGVMRTAYGACVKCGLIEFI